MDDATALVATESLFDVSLPDGAVGCVDRLCVSVKGTPMAVVTGNHGGRYFTRRVPLRVIEPCGREWDRWLNRDR